MSATPIAARPPSHTLAEIHDLDQLLAEIEQPDGCAWFKRLGLDVPGVARVRAQRERLAHMVEPRWLQLYERLHGRYPRAIAAVRSQVCTGCYVTLPPSARGRAQGAEAPVCQGCGRILLWT